MRKTYRRPIEGLEDRKLLAGEKILFIRGADRSGAGITGGVNDAQRTEQLSDINNNDESVGNHGWGQLRSLLQSVGYVVSQQTESLENGAPGSGQTQGKAIDLTAINLSQYALVVFGSNNAQDYSKASIDALDAYVRAGGSALFVSDGNWGSSWTDAASSDQLFMSRYGWTMNQDQNAGIKTVSGANLSSSSNGILNNVTSFTGEGVSPITVGTPAKRQANTIVAGISGLGQVRQNNGNPGTLRDATGTDAALVTATVASGRVAAIFDRNGWFNGNGNGTDLGKANNQTLALNLFSYLAKGVVETSVEPDLITVTQPEPPPYRVVTIGFNVNLGASISKDDIVVQRRKDRRPVAGSQWKFSTALDGQNRTTVTVRVTANNLGGKYRLNVNKNSVTGPSGLTNSKDLAVRFFLNAITGSSIGGQTVGGTLVGAPAANAFSGKVAGGVSSEFFGSEEVRYDRMGKPMLV